MAVKIHHLNVGSFCPAAPTRIGPLVCHALLIEGARGLTLVDTGFGVQDCAQPRQRLGIFVKHAGAKLDLQETAARQVEALGFKRNDVRHIVVTHLDLDHAGGLSDFPHAAVHCFYPEYLNANRRLRGIRHRMRYRPVQWVHGPQWKFYENDGTGENWKDFMGVKPLDSGGDVGTSIALVPLPGHTVGHCGVAIETQRGWMLHAGDAYFHRGERDGVTRTGWMIEVFERLVAQDNSLRVDQVKKLKALKDVDVFCAHDPIELERHQHHAHTG